MSFCNIIVDKEDNIVILDPGGTHVDCRNRGWAGAVIYEGLNRLCAKGMVKAYTGSNQPFLFTLRDTIDNLIRYLWKEQVFIRFS